MPVRRDRRTNRDMLGAPRGASLLGNVLANVPSQNVVDEGLVPHPAPACFLAELIEHSGVDANRNELARFLAQWRAAHASLGLHNDLARKPTGRRTLVKQGSLAIGRRRASTRRQTARLRRSHRTDSNARARAEILRGNRRLGRLRRPRYAISQGNRSQAPGQHQCEPCT